MLNLLYITNRPEVAVIAEDAGVNTVFVDLETIGKSERQGGLILFRAITRLRIL